MNQNWYDELPGEIKKSVDKGLDDARNDKITPHAEVKKKYEKWLRSMSSKLRI